MVQEERNSMNMEQCNRRQIREKGGTALILDETEMRVLHTINISPNATCTKLIDHNGDPHATGATAALLLCRTALRPIPH